MPPSAPCRARSSAEANKQELAELLAIPVCTSLEGKSSFDETHPLALGSGGRAYPKAVRSFLDRSDVILGVGCSFTETNFGIAMPQGKTIIHAADARAAGTIDLHFADGRVPAQTGGHVSPQPFRPAKRVERKGRDPYLPGQADLFDSED